MAISNEQLLALRAHVYVQANLVNAMQFIVEALTHGPVCASALAFGSASRGIPQGSLDAAREKLGVEVYHDEYGIACWRLKEETPCPL